MMSIKNESFLPANGSHDFFQQLKHLQPSVFTLIRGREVGKLLICGLVKIFFPLFWLIPTGTFIYFLILLAPNLCLLNPKRLVKRKLGGDFAYDESELKNWCHRTVEPTSLTALCVCRRVFTRKQTASFCRRSLFPSVHVLIMLTTMSLSGVFTNICKIEMKQKSSTDAHNSF